MRMWSLFLALTLSVVAASGLFQEPTPASIVQDITPESQQPISDGLDVDQYLRSYGYMNEVNERSVDYTQRRTDALKLFQRFANLQVTGEADEDTRQHMLRPRCGVKDIQVDAPVNARWNVTEITYKIQTFTTDMSRDDTRKAFVDAISQWEGPSKLKFKRIGSGKPIMEVKFVNRKHRPCPYAMDGPGGVLAHAYFPTRHPFGGDIHFDDGETYKYKQGRGVDLVSVALHEAGHALGLGHENKRGSIMVPWYTGQKTLGPSDIKRIKMLYA